jgi:hypothetical protein
MRRILSILLLLALGLGQAASAAALTSGPASGWTGKIDESRIPACCRRNGKHHCEMGSQGNSAQSAGETSIFAKDCCPCAPRALASTAPTVVAFLGVSAKSTGYASSLRVPFPTTASPLINDRRSRPKRGPPSDLEL